MLARRSQRLYLVSARSPKLWTPCRPINTLPRSHEDEQAPGSGTPCTMRLVKHRSAHPARFPQPGRTFRRVELPPPLVSKLDIVVARASSQAAVHQFEALVKAGTCKVDDVKVFVGRLRSILQPLDLPTRRSMCLELQAGGKALKWLWDNHPPGDESPYRDPDLGDALCWFIIPEGLEDYIWQWFQIEARAANDGGRKALSPMSSKGMKWAQVLFGRLIAAHLAWSPDGTADNAIKCFIAADEMFPWDGGGISAGPGFETRATLGFLQAALGITKHIHRSSSPPGSDELFDAFHRSVVRTWGPAYRLEDSAKLALFHPSKPDPWPLYNMLKADNTDLLGKYVDARTIARHRFFNDVFRAAYILHMQGASEEAGWLESFVEEKDPHIYDNKDVNYARVSLEPKIKKCRRRLAAEKDSRSPGPHAE